MCTLCICYSSEKYLFIVVFFGSDVFVVICLRIGLYNDCVNFLRTYGHDD